jgi:hypothetical protein
MVNRQNGLVRIGRAGLLAALTIAVGLSSGTAAWSRSTDTGGATSQSIVSFLTPGHNVTCALGLFRGSFTSDVAGESEQARCWSRRPNHLVQLFRDGRTRVCSGRCWNSPIMFTYGAPVLAFGHQLAVHGFRCASQPGTVAVTCTVTVSGPGSGKGFRIGSRGVSRIG